MQIRQLRELLRKAQAHLQEAQTEKHALQQQLEARRRQLATASRGKRLLSCARTAAGPGHVGYDSEHI